MSLRQDAAAIPMLALLPLPALGAVADDAGSAWVEAARAAALSAANVFGGRPLLRPALRWIASSDTPEVFTAAALLLVVATAAPMEAAGVSMALGAFLAGGLLAGSEYRRELETDLDPFKGLLLGLFFVAVGMGIDIGVVASRPLVVAAVVVAFLVVKALVLVAMARAMPIPRAERPVFVILLAQSGEFGFVVCQAATQAGAITAADASVGAAAITLSMLATPLLLLGADRRVAPRLPAPQLDAPQAAPVIVAGFGRYGRVIGRMLSAQGYAATVLDHDAEQVATVRKFGWPAHDGDATRVDLLRKAGAADARLIVVAIDDALQNPALVDPVRQHFPRTTRVARPRNVSHYCALRARGVEHIERETFDASPVSARRVLAPLGVERHTARTQAMRFRRHGIEPVEQMAPHHADAQRPIAVAMHGRASLEAMWARERDEAARGGGAPRRRLARPRRRAAARVTPLSEDRRPAA